MEFQYATDDGKAFSGKLGRPFSRNQFIEWFTNETVIALASTAADAPRDDNDLVVRLRLIGAIKRELEVLWGELFSRLGPVEDAALTDDSPAAVAFRQAIVSIWTKLVSMGIHKTPIGRAGSTDSVQVATRNSLASRVQKAIAEGEAPTGRWVPVQIGFDAYFRVVEGAAKGEYRTLLAMHFKLAGQTNVTIPSVTDQMSLRRLGQIFHAIDSQPPVRDRMSGGGRLVVLAPGLVDEILSVPLDDSEVSLEGNTVTGREESVTDPADEILVSDSGGSVTVSLSDSAEDDSVSLDEILCEARRAGR